MIADVVPINIKPKYVPVSDLRVIAAIFDNWADPSVGVKGYLTNYGYWVESRSLMEWKKTHPWATISRMENNNKKSYADYDVRTGDTGRGILGSPDECSDGLEEDRGNS